MTCKEFWKKHRAKIIGGAAVITGVVIAYNCGTNEVVKRCLGYHDVSCLTKDGSFADKLDEFLSETFKANFYHDVKINVPRDKVAEYVAERIAELPEKQKTVNLMMISIDK